MAALSFDPVETTLGQALDLAAAAYPDRPAASFGQRGLTYAALRERADRLAAGLAGLGLRRGEQLALWLPSCLEWIEVELAAARLGLVLVPISTRYKQAEVEYILRQSDAAALILADRWQDLDFLELLGAMTPLPLGEGSGSAFPALRQVVVLGERTPAGAVAYAELAASAPLPPERHPPARPDDPLMILYTSGTTGFPKGAMLSHRNVVFNAFQMGERLRLTERDRILLAPPLFHVFGCVNGVVAAVTHGASLVVMERFEAGAALELLERQACTAIYGTATMFRLLLEHERLERTDRSTLRTGMIGSMPVPDVVMRGIVERLGAREVCNSYGQTEASVSLLNEAGAPLEQLLQGVGPPIPGVELKVVDLASGQQVPPGQDGELCVRGPHLMLGYYNLPERTAEAVDADGWLHSGDLGRQVGPGLYRVTGRIKDMYISGGLKIYPAEVENLLYQHPAVLQAAIVGVPDERLGEVGHAFVQPRPGQRPEPAELIEFVRQRLASYKAPRFVTLVDEFPTTANGKVQKFRLREAAVAQARPTPRAWPAS